MLSYPLVTNIVDQGRLRTRIVGDNVLNWRDALEAALIAYKLLTYEVERDKAKLTHALETIDRLEKQVSTLSTELLHYITVQPVTD